MEAVTVLHINQEPGLVETVDVRAELQRILEERFVNPYGKKVIELGLGEQTLMPFLSNKFGEKVFRMDLCDWNARNKKINSGLVQGELQCLPIAGKSVDVVISANCFESDLDLVRALQEIERVLIDGGESLLIVSEEHFQNGRLKAETTLAIVGSIELMTPVEEKNTWAVTLKKKS